MTGAPAGWYPDPGRTHEHRYWDGERWTEGVSTGGVVSEVALSPEGATEAWSELQDQRARWSGPVAAVAIGAALLSVVAQIVLYLLGDAVGGEILAFLLAEVGLYGGFFLTCWLVSQRRGTKSMVRDFGLRYRRGDWWRGLVVSLAARAAAVLVAVVLVLISEDLAGTNTDVFEDEEGLALLLLFAVSALVFAPFFEELFFRGLIQRALENVLPIGAVIPLQALLFGLFHLGGAEGAGNVGVICATGAAGAVFGYVAWRYHRLGPGMAGHAFFNVLPVLVLLLDR